MKTAAHVAWLTRLLLFLIAAIALTGLMFRLAFDHLMLGGDLAGATPGVVIAPHAPEGTTSSVVWAERGRGQ